MTDPRIAALADLAVRGGANVQPGQVVAVGCQPGQEAMARAVAHAAYRAGARYVDVSWHDPWVKRERLRHAAADSLDWVPPWLGQRATALGELSAAVVSLAGPVAPGVFDDCDPDRVSRDRLPSVPEMMRLVMDASVNWTVVPFPNPAWAAVVFPDDPPDQALERLWAAVVRVCRLDEDDPVDAWRRRGAELGASAERLDARRIDALRFEGPGTDLTVGLLPSSRWLGGGEHRRDGLPHLPNVPTEEVFTTPDPMRTQGTVAATMPLDIAGTLVEGLRIRFEGGRAVEIDADRGAEVIRGRANVDAGAARLGEVALVDGSGRIGPLGITFQDTLLDENAASHIALGAAYPAGVGDEHRDRANVSDIHIDFMIGGPGVTVNAVAADGTESPLLVDGRWVGPDD